MIPVFKCLRFFRRKSPAKAVLSSPECRLWNIAFNLQKANWNETLAEDFPIVRTV